MRWSVACALAVAVVSGCGGGSPERAQGEIADRRSYALPDAPRAPTGPLDRGVEAALDGMLEPAGVGVLDRALLARVAAAQDPRLAWLVADLLRFFAGSAPEENALVAAFERLTGFDPREDPLFPTAPGASSPTTSSPGTRPPRPATVSARAPCTSASSPAGGPSSTTPAPASTGVASPGAAC